MKSYRKIRHNDYCSSDAFVNPSNYQSFPEAMTPDPLT